MSAARAGSVSAGCVAVADHQTAGRGRLGRVWEAPPAGANLLCSVLLRPPVDRLHLSTAAVAVAGRRAALSFGCEAGIKWPNDLVDSASRKLAGVLAEAEAPWVVVGIGMNIGWAPEGAARLGDGVARDDALAVLLDELAPLVADWSSVAGEYRAGCVTLGRTVRVEMPDPADTFTGVAADIDDDGHLLVETDVCLKTVTAADIVHLR
jgi:BirA family transcriptional regulator, biotin operon repressor / biotin---[acetyl-CoA-carboxylase] ligase